MRQVDVTVNSPESGVIVELFASEGDTINVGGNLFSIDTDGKPSAADAAPESKPAASGDFHLTIVLINQLEPKKEEVKPAVEQKPAAPKAETKAAPTPAAAPQPAPAAQKSAAPAAAKAEGAVAGSRLERKVKMSRMRLRIAERLKESQNTAASLTTFNEIDMRYISYL